MAKAEFDAAIFFDNDLGYLDDVKTKCPGVTLVKVKEIILSKNIRMVIYPF